MTTMRTSTRTRCVLGATAGIAALATVFVLHAGSSPAASPATPPPATAAKVAATEGDSPLKNRTIAYVLTERYWAVYEGKDVKADCPDGMNDGPREQFKKLFPEDGKQRTVMETQLAREGYQWHPTTSPEAFPFHEERSKVSYGLNLDGKAGPNDFVSPEGEQGIDNQLYRVIGCIANYRSSGTIYHFENEFMRRYDNDRMVIEITGVDSLENDDDVTVTTYRGLDGLLTDATGNNTIPGGTQRIDMRWGKDYIQKLKGKIVNGVLITEPIDRIEIPWGVTFETSGYQVFRGMRLKLKLTSHDADGVMAGYVDVDAFTYHLNTSWSTHHHSYGQLSSPSEYRAMRRLADGYPDPKTGQNTAISSAVIMKFSQVFTQHPDSAGALVTKN
jgi:hypothetical protein